MRFLLLAVGLFFAGCSLNNVTEDSSLGKYFTENGLGGCFGLFDNVTGQFTIYHMDRYRDSAYTPGPTFTIVSSMVGVETGRVKDSGTVIPWDGVIRGIPAWNHDLSMREAFHYSATPWYADLAERIGRDTMQKWIDTLGYGSIHGKAEIGNNLDTFWLDNSVKVTADEQLGLMKRLYFGQLPFQPRTQRIVKNMMLREDNSNYKLSFKTGWAHTPDNHALGWIVGWVEENNHPYFFVLQTESPDPAYDMDAVGLNMLKGILKQLGFLEGKR